MHYITAELLMHLKTYRLKAALSEKYMYYTGCHTQSISTFNV